MNIMSKLGKLKNRIIGSGDERIPPWMPVAERELGMKEVPGSGDNPRILEYHATTTLKSTEDSVAWCSSFVNWVMREVGRERSHSAAARSWLGVQHRLPGFRKYAVVIMKRGTSSWQGHVGFAIEDLGSHIVVLGGNQSDMVSLARYPKASVLGYVWPRPSREEINLA